MQYFIVFISALRLNKKIKLPLFLAECQCVTLLAFQTFPKHGEGVRSSMPMNTMKDKENIRQNNNCNIKSKMLITRLYFTGQITKYLFAHVVFSHHIQSEMHGMCTVHEIVMHMAYCH